MSTESPETTSADKSEELAKQAAHAGEAEGDHDDSEHDEHDEDEPEGSKPIHTYDDIEECDNLLPRWWLYSLFLTIVFAFGYWFHYHVFKGGQLPMDAYNAEMQAQAEAETRRVRAAGVMTPAALTALSHNAALVSQGQDIFRTTCATCHGPNAGGLIGPNLTDEFWIHGGAPDQIYNTVTNGVPARGMAAWGPQLGVERVQAVTAYLLTIRNTHVAGGRPPQGDRMQ